MRCVFLMQNHNIHEDVDLAIMSACAGNQSDINRRSFTLTCCYVLLCTSKLPQGGSVTQRTMGWNTCCLEMKASAFQSAGLLACLSRVIEHLWSHSQLVVSIELRANVLIKSRIADLFIFTDTSACPIYISYLTIKRACIHHNVSLGIRLLTVTHTLGMYLCGWHGYRMKKSFSHQ